MEPRRVGMDSESYIDTLGDMEKSIVEAAGELDHSMPIKGFVNMVETKLRKEGLTAIKTQIRDAIIHSASNGTIALKKIPPKQIIVLPKPR